MSIEFGISENYIYSLEGNINFFAHLLRFSKFQFDIPQLSNNFGPSSIHHCCILFGNEAEGIIPSL
jgi:hypothetical protein